MKVKAYSLLGKSVIVVISYVLCILKWLNVLPNAQVSEIWGAAATAYGLLLGTVDFNIVRDNEVENKQLS